MTDAVFKDEVRKETKMEDSDGELNRFLEVVKINLNVLTSLIGFYNKTAECSFTQLVSIENDLTLFTFQHNHTSRYKANTVSECIITNVGGRFGSRSLQQLFDCNGMPLDVQNNLINVCNQLVDFEVENVEK